MIHFTKNSGQYAHDVAYVARVPDDFNYRGAGVARLAIENATIFGLDELPPIRLSDDNEWEFEGRIVPHSMLNEDAMPTDDLASWDVFDPPHAHVILSCHEIVVLYGTAAAALLNIIGDHA